MKKDERISKLALEVVNSWDMDTLLNYAVERLEDFYKSNLDDFETEYKEIFE